MAHTTNRRRLDPAFAHVVKYGLRADKSEDDHNISIARENQVLSNEQVVVLLRATQEIDAEELYEGDLFRLIVALAATGARYSQVVRMRVGDVQQAQSRLLVPVSRKGTGDKNGAIAIPVGKDVIDALLPAVTGRQNDAPLLETWLHKQRPGSMEWHRDRRGPWGPWGSALGRPWGAIRERAGMPKVIPYALRHSSIVRCLRTNLPIRLVAALHDTSVQMIERHYAKWIVDGLSDLVARAVVPLVPSSAPVT